MIAQRTAFRDRQPSPQGLDELILIELAIRDQAELNEEQHPLAAKSGDTCVLEVNARAVASHEGWGVKPSEIADPGVVASALWQSNEVRFWRKAVYGTARECQLLQEDLDRRSRRDWA